jgi:hypothetical protein
MNFQYPILQEDNRTLYDHPLTKRGHMRKEPPQQTESENSKLVPTVNLLPLEISLAILIFVLITKL